MAPKRKSGGKEELEEEYEDEEQQAPWEEGDEEDDRRKRRKSKQEDSGEQEEGDEFALEDDALKPGSDRLAELRKILKEKRRAASTVGSSEVSQQFLRAPFSDPVVVSDDFDLLNSNTSIDVSSIDSLGAELELNLLHCDSGESGEQQSMSQYKSHLTSLSADSPLSSVYAAEASLRGTQMESLVCRPQAVDAVDMSTHAWPSDFAGTNPYANQQLELFILPQNGFLDPQYEPHGAAKWHYLVFGTKEYVLVPPDGDHSAAVCATVLQGQTLFVPPGWKIGEVASEHSCSIIGDFYLASCMPTKHHDIWKLEKEGMLETADETQIDGFRYLLWYTAAYMDMCIPGEKGNATAIAGAPRLIQSMPGVYEPMPKESNETGKLTSLLMRFNKSKNKVIPPGIEDPGALLEDLRARVDFHRGRSKGRKRQRASSTPTGENNEATAAAAADDDDDGGISQGGADDEEDDAKKQRVDDDADYVAEEGDTKEDEEDDDGDEADEADEGE